jgi:heme/copper-type cytochrome/quinol oxidase subunit 3
LSVVEKANGSLKRKPAIPNGVMGMAFFIAAEVMFFASFISAYMILRAGVPVWPPWGQPRLPIWSTGFNTVVLIASGVLLGFSKRAFKAEDLGKAKKLFLAAAFAGTFFLVFQGYEWVQLIHFGLTLTSSTYGGIFYVTIGVHALHAVSALAALLWLYPRIGKYENSKVMAEFTVTQLFWYFVVMVWPILYVTVYLY